MPLVQRCDENDARLRRCGVNDARKLRCDQSCDSCADETPYEYVFVASALVLCDHCHASEGLWYSHELVSGDLNGALRVPRSVVWNPSNCQWISPVVAVVRQKVYSDAGCASLIGSGLYALRWLVVRVVFLNRARWTVTLADLGVPTSRAFYGETPYLALPQPCAGPFVCENATTCGMYGCASGGAVTFEAA